MRPQVLLVGFVAGLPMPSVAQAWGDGGHRIICQIAFERLTPEGRTLVDNIMADLAEVRDPFDGCPSCTNAEITAAELTAWQTFDVAGWPRSRSPTHEPAPTCRPTAARPSRARSCLTITSTWRNPSR